MDWWTIARAQDGVISAAQLAAAGRGYDAVSRMARFGELVRLCRGTYLVGGAPLTFRSRLWAAIVATDGVLVRSSAGLLWGVIENGSDHDAGLEVWVSHTRRVSAPSGVRVHRGTLPREQLRTRSGFPVTSRRWTVLDLIASSSASDAMRLADRAIQRGWITDRACAERLRTHPGLHGNGRLRLVADRLGDGAAAESERILHALLRRAGITGWSANVDVWSAGELIAVVDVAIPSRRLAIEVDGMAYHVDVDRFRRDRTRQNALVALGWTVLRFTWADLTERPGYVVGAIRGLAA